MQRNRFQPFRTLAAAAAVVVAIACADRAAPTALAALDGSAGDKKADSASAKCDLTLTGTVRRFTGTGDSTSDTLGTRVPLKGARVQVTFVAPLPPDTVPHDSIPRDSVPRDSVPRDSVPRDSIPRDSVPHDSTTLRMASSVSHAAADTIPPAPKPTATAITDKNGQYTIKHLCAGIYRVEVFEPDTQRSIFTFITLRGDGMRYDFTFAPKR